MSERVSSLSSRKRRLALALLGATAMTSLLGGCIHDQDNIVVGSTPDDYRLRHPIVVSEAAKTTELFVGSERGGLTSVQRSDVAGVAQEWLRSGTGAIVIETPVRSSNARAAAQTVSEAKALLVTAGVPARAVLVRNYQPAGPRQFATVRVRYPKIVADAGPCGLWPEDLGPSVLDKTHFENREYSNFGCASQRNLAAMVDNPSDLVQPRAETPSNSARRTAAFAKYRSGYSVTSEVSERLLVPNPGQGNSSSSSSQ